MPHESTAVFPGRIPDAHGGADASAPWLLSEPEPVDDA